MFLHCLFRLSLLIEKGKKHFQDLLLEFEARYATASHLNVYVLLICAVHVKSYHGKDTRGMEKAVFNDHIVISEACY